METCRLLGCYLNLAQLFDRTEFHLVGRDVVPWRVSAVLDVMDSRDHGLARIHSELIHDRNQRFPELLELFHRLVHIKDVDVAVHLHCAMKCAARHRSEAGTRLVQLLDCLVVFGWGESRGSKIQADCHPSSSSSLNVIQSRTVPLSSQGILFSQAM